LSGNFLIDFLTGLIPLILSLTVHEYSHAWSARRLGDDTAERLGRLTLNPLAHIDPFGTILLPMALAYMHLPAFGWAKPVPVNPAGFRRSVRMGTGMAITAGAGPAANVVLAVLTTIVVGVVARVAPDLLRSNRGIGALLISVIQINVILALFNLIPIPPLDGSRIVAWLLPFRLRNQWHELERFAPLLLVLIFWFGGRVVSGPIQAVASLLFELTRALA
jgi:Zn-dependent protease